MTEGGNRNLAPEGIPPLADIDMEQVYALNPEVIFIFQKSGLKPPTSVGKDPTVRRRRSKPLNPSTLVGGGSVYKGPSLIRNGPFILLTTLLVCLAARGFFYR